MQINKTLKLSLVAVIVIIGIFVFFHVVFAPKPIKQANKALKGSITQVHNAAKFAIVNIGKAEGVRDNMQMLVLRKNRKIAVITINDVRKNISAGEISHIASGVKLKEGDTVVEKYSPYDIVN
ncbi:MAG: hypothetical protein PHP17_07670 [Candidatus Omnitrophica bacterium]|nr:hypothetical protein [Candidatus Omnitrophota bacterium]